MVIKAMNVGEILDGAFSLFREQYKTYLGVSGISIAISLVLVLIVIGLLFLFFCRPPGNGFRHRVGSVPDVDRVFDPDRRAGAYRFGTDSGRKKAPGKPGGSGWARVGGCFSPLYST